MRDYQYGRNAAQNRCCDSDSNEIARSRGCGCGTNFREAVCIHTDKIYDSCRELHCSRYITIIFAGFLCIPHIK